MPIRDNDPRPAYQQLADELRQAITTGHYKPGDRLPSTRELSEAHGIALMTVRHALRLLQDENLVVGRQGRGVFVLRSPDPPGGPVDPDLLVTAQEHIAKAIKILEQIYAQLDRQELD